MSASNVVIKAFKLYAQDHRFEPHHCIDALGLASLSLANGPVNGCQDGWMREFEITFTEVRPNRQMGTMVMRRMALVARKKLWSNMAVPRIEPSSRG